MMTEQAAINSPTPSEIMANTVPALRVENAPTIMASPMPKRPPKTGRITSGMVEKKSDMFIMCIQAKPPTPA